MQGLKKPSGKLNKEETVHVQMSVWARRARGDDTNTGWCAKEDER